MSATRRSHPVSVGVILAVICAVLGPQACAPQTEPQGTDALMRAGLEALYERNDPATAAAQFRQVLAQNPNHYGATYQLAVALDQAGQPTEAQAWWEKVLPMAESYTDEATVARARTRLARAEGGSDKVQELMQAGLDALYKQRNPAAAIPRFRAVLALNPTHYGATYQLAAALEATGATAEARVQWEKVLKMAEEAHDTPTADTARARLAHTP